MSMIPETEQQLAIEDELRAGAAPHEDDDSSSSSAPATYRVGDRNEDEEEVVHFAEVKFDEAPAPASAWKAKTGYSADYLERITPRLPAEKIPTPPQWTYFSGVFSFPWTGSAMQRWSLLTVGCTLTMLVASFVFPTLLGVISGAAGMNAVMLGFFGLPGFWIGFWTTSYAAACSLPIVIETSAGADEIDGWPEPQWRDWAADLYYFLYLTSIVCVVAWLAGLSLSVPFGFSPATQWTLTLFLAVSLAPIVLLSSLEASSFWVPFSPNILRSLRQQRQSWLGFYGVYLSFTSTVLTAMLIAVRYADLASAIVTGPLLATLIMIDARLIGRLGWRILGGEPKRKRRRKKREKQPATTLQKKRPRRRSEADV